MAPSIEGLHHVTAIASDPQTNVDFYVSVLGMRMVKRTINYDDPGTYHFYYGDEVGRPGTILTFFAWPDAPRGRIGTGQATVTKFSIPYTSEAFWRDRLAHFGIEVKASSGPFAETNLLFQDPDGLNLAFVPSENAGAIDGGSGSLPAEHAIRGFHSVTMRVERHERTADLLTTTLGFRKVGTDGMVTRYEVAEGGVGKILDVEVDSGGKRGAVAAGTVHHIAFRTPDDPDQHEWQQTLSQARFNVSPIMDRQYFHSIYFREPGGVLFEIATDPPGFTADETPSQLGTSLKLPEWLEPERTQIERGLKPIRLPDAPERREG